MSELFTTILSDPPWRYRDRVGPGLGFGADRIRGRRGAAGYYPTMSIEEIIAMYRPTLIVGGSRDRSLAQLAGHEIADHAHLYLWTTNAFMVEAHRVAEAWGFRPRTILTWCKPRIGMGSYFRNTTEHVIFAVRGKLPVLRHDQKTHFDAPVGRHSEKPAIVYDIIERMSPGPYLELFTRARRDGWTSHGDELKCEPEEPIFKPRAIVEIVHPDPGLEWPT